MSKNRDINNRIKDVENDFLNELQEFKTSNDMISDLLNELRKSFKENSEYTFKYSFNQLLPKIELLNDWTNEKLIKTINSNKISN